MTYNERKRFLSVRLSPAEFKEVQNLYKSSGCRSLTAYAKKMMMHTPGHQGRELVDYLRFVIESLNRFEEMLDEKMKYILAKDIANIKSETSKFYTKWSRVRL